MNFKYKVLTIIVALVLALLMVIPTHAETVESPQSVPVAHAINEPRINNKVAAGISYTVDEKNNILTFLYTGEQKFLRWTLIDKNGKVYPVSFNDKDYKVVEMNDSKLVIEVLNWEAFEAPDGYTVNAEVQGDVQEIKKDTSKTSPKTGRISLFVRLIEFLKNIFR